MHVPRKALNAQNHGAAAVLIFNEGQQGATDASSEHSAPPTSTSWSSALSFADRGRAAQPADRAQHRDRAHHDGHDLGDRQAANVLAETQGGDPNRVIVQGSHLDSVAPGPGINDNGSGSADNLESAIQIAGAGSSRRTRSASPGGAPRRRPARLAVLRRQPVPR